MTDERLPERDAETYLGDGLYASFDGFRVWLRAPRPEGDHRVAMEPDTWLALHKWVHSYSLLKAHIEDKR
jgi:hypothetical protein